MSLRQEEGALKYRLSAEAESTGILPNDVELEADGTTYRFERDDRGHLSRIAVEQVVSDYAGLIPFPYRDEQGLLSLDLRVFRSSFHQELLRALQYLESIGSLEFGISRLQWRDIRNEWIPESDQEREQLKGSITSVAFTSEGRPQDSLAIAPERLEEALRVRSEVDDLLTVPMAFYREGNNELSNRSYVAAFIQFYLYIEHMYANGKTKNDAVERELVSSRDVVSAARTWLEALSKSDSQDKVNELASFNALLNERGWPLDPVHLVKLIVRLRGEVHHSSKTSKRRQGHPFNNEDYRCAAYLCGAICAQSVRRIYDTHEGPR